MELERDRDAAEFPTTCVTSRFSNPETSVVPSDFCCSSSPSYFSSMWNSLSDASRLKLKRLRLVLTTKRATSVSLKQQQANLKTDIFWSLNKPAVVRRKGKKSIDRKRTSAVAQFWAEWFRHLVEPWSSMLPRRKKALPSQLTLVQSHIPICDNLN